MQKARGYICHKMHGNRSVPQSIQQKIIRQYCEQNALEFCLSATEFEGSDIMLRSIKEDCIVMYSIWCMPKSKAARQRLYESGKDVRFAAENIHKIDKDFLETVFTLGEWHERCEFRWIAAYLNQKGLLCKDECRKA